MKKCIAMIPIICLMMLALCAPSTAQGLRDDFTTLADWKPLAFPKIPSHSTYAVGGEKATGFVDYIEVSFR